MRRASARALTLMLCSLAAAPVARAACPPVPAAPAADRPATAAQIDGYVRAVARASPVISTGVAGLSVQSRPLRYAIASALLRGSPAHCHGAAARRARGRGRAAPATRRRSSGWPAPCTATSPAGGDADLQLLHELAGRCRDPLLRRVVVVVLPDQNPDGRGVRTRVNFNGFDLNRDWLALTQPESQARLRLAAGDAAAGLRRPARAGWRRVLRAALLRRRCSTSFPTPRSPPSATSSGRRCARAFRRKGYPSSSDGTFDLLYPGYGDSATTLLFGAVGMTFEVGRREPVRAARRRAPRRRPRRACARSPATAPRCCEAWAGSFAQARAQGAHGVLQHRRPRPRVYGYALGAGAEPLVAQLMAEGWRSAGSPPTPRWRACGRMAPPSPGTPATLAAGTYLVSAAQPLKHWIEALLGQSPEAGGPSTSDVNAWSRPLLMGIPGGTLGAPPPDAPAAAVPVLAAAQPLAGRRLALLGDPAAFASVVPGAAQPNAGTSWARFVLARLGAQVDVVDDAAARRRCARRARCLRGGRRRAGVALGPGAGRRSQPSSRAAGPSSDGARGASPWRGRPASRRRRSPRARRRPGSLARRSPWAAASCVDNDDPLVAGGHVAADYGAVLSGWALGSPAGRTAIVDERVGAGRAVLFAFDPVFRASSESAEALLTNALTGASPGSR